MPAVCGAVDPINQLVWGSHIVLYVSEDIHTVWVRCYVYKPGVKLIISSDFSHKYSSSVDESERIRHLAREDDKYWT